MLPKCRPIRDHNVPKKPPNQDRGSATNQKASRPAAKSTLSSSSEPLKMPAVVAGETSGEGRNSNKLRTLSREIVFRNYDIDHESLNVSRLC